VFFIKNMIMGNLKWILLVMELQIALLGYLVFSSELKKRDSQDDFKTNYEIDLKADHYLIKGAYDGKVHRVEFNDLEEWVINDNI